MIFVVRCRIGIKYNLWLNYVLFLSAIDHKKSQFLIRFNLQLNL